MSVNPTPIKGIDSAEMSNLNPKSDIIQAVTVVPMFAPIITPTDCTRDSSPALTKLTTITVVALEDWIIAVIKRPVRTLFKEFEVIAASMPLIFSPATFWRAPLISVIPYRNRPREPNSFSI